MNYAIEDQFGNQLRAGLHVNEARRIARALANKRQEPVLVYPEDGDDTEDETEIVAPNE